MDYIGSSNLLRNCILHSPNGYRFLEFTEELYSIDSPNGL